MKKYVYPALAFLLIILFSAFFIIKPEKHHTTGQKYQNNQNNQNNQLVNISENNSGAHKVKMILIAASGSEGLIGITSEKPIDNPVDNVFHFRVNEKIAVNESVWLEYDLNGVADFTSVSHSINDQLAVGGYLVRRREGWMPQKEQISASLLKQGENIIRFSVPDGKEYGYQVRNIKVRIERTKCGNTQRRLVINQPSTAYYYQRLGYLQGFVTGPGSERARIVIADDGIRMNKGVFETLVEKPDDSGESWQVPVKAIFPDGQVLTVSVRFTNPEPLDISNSFESNIRHSEILAQRNRPFHMGLGSTRLSGKPGDLPVDTVLSVTALRDIDMAPLDAGMVNVTKEFKGFRFLPHGTQFKHPVNLEMAYDTTKIPDGYSESDIRTYFFDEESHHWVALPRDTVFYANKTVVSKTTHFTDMINGIIKVPESPETQGYTPTSMKEVKAANPASGINLIAPPAANSMGNASLSYPINIPGGRQGMQPNFGIQYNSGGGNGWLGLGWDLSIPSIAVETRWGVPRYDAAKESETYTLAGEQLTPLAHRSDWINRTSEKQFYPRVEGSFNKIIRHGSSPKNYWWEVTDRNGTRYFYGGIPGSGVAGDAVLKDDAGNIAYWALLEERDLNDNFVRYHYTIVSDVGVAGGSVAGKQMYIDNATYTGFNSEEGNYKVLFTRDRQMEEPKRTDITISARYGFKEVTADLLRKIEVQYKNQNIRSYILHYTQGVFYKTLLDTITEYDASGKKFNSHAFAYYDDVDRNGSLQPFTAGETWNSGDDGIKGDFVSGKVGFNDKASALSGTKSNSWGAGLAVTVGPWDAQVWSKSNTAGGNYSYSQSDSYGMLSLIDVNGDGLPDKLIMDGGKLKYRPQVKTETSGAPVFGDLQDIAGINEFLKTKSKTNTYGVESNFGVFAGVNYSSSKTMTSVYFADVNGDGLIDIVKNGQVWFNHINKSGLPEFTTSSADTPSPVNEKGSVNSTVYTVDPQELEDAIDQNPLHDVVRMWQAPFDGSIKITAPVNLIQDNSSDRSSYTTADGVRVAIQFKGTELWNTNIAADDYQQKIPAGISNLSVKKGDRVYFRVQSKFDGAYDQVSWNPVIEYSIHNDTIVDANNEPLYRFAAGDDFLISSDQAVGTPINGQIRIEGMFMKPVTSDDVNVEIVRDLNDESTVVWQKTYPWNNDVNENINLDRTVQKGENYHFLVSSSTNIRWKDISWNPHVYYIYSADASYPEVTDEKGNPLIEFNPVTEKSIYPDPLSKTIAWMASGNKAVTITPVLGFANKVSGEVEFSVKRLNKLVGKCTLTILDGKISSAPAPISLTVDTGDKLFFEFHTSNRDLALQINRNIAEIAGQKDTVEAIAGLHTVMDNTQYIFGAMNRHWGQFVYNGNRDRASQPINESDLHQDQTLADGKGIDLSGKTANEMNNSGVYDPRKSLFIMMVPDAKEQSWKGYDDLTWLKATSVSSSRMGDDNITPFNPLASGGSGARGIDKINKSDNVSFSAGAGLSGSYSTGTDNVVTDFMDMNGDRYPDIVTDKNIQFTYPQGNLSDEVVSHGKKENHKTSTTSTGVTFGGSFSTSQKNPGSNVRKSSFSVIGQASMSGSYGGGTDDAEYTWMDINGDGLPDRIYKGGDVELNLGYSFASKEHWGFQEIRSGKSESFSGSIGINIGNTSIAAGIGLSRSDNTVPSTLQDVNGDGLLDMISDTKPLKVRLNTGNGFGPEISWGGVDQVNKNSSTTESANGAYTYGIPLIPPFIVVKLAFNPSINIGRTFCRDEKQLSDVDGDGFPDYVESSAENELKVSRSSIARTNLLKTVSRPMGAGFELDYKQTGNTYNMPQNQWCMSSVKVYDGHSGDGADFMLSTFEYEDGYQDRYERAFYGFRTVKTHQHDTQNKNALYRTSVQTFINDNYYEKGLLASDVLEDAQDRKFDETINTYLLKDPVSMQDITDATVSIDISRAFPALTETKKYFYEGQPQATKSTRTTFGYGSYGNVVSYTDFGDPDVAGDDISSAIIYHELKDKYVVSVPKSIQVIGNGKTMRRRETSIDNNTGDITQIRQFLESGSPAAYDMFYDKYGNIDSIVRPQNEKGQRMYFGYDYDNEVHNYVIMVRDAYGYRSSSTYDYRFGQVLGTKDINGQETKYEIDNVGRITGITGPYELKAGLDYTIRFQYFPDAVVPWAHTWHYDPSHPDNPIETALFIDGLGRVLQTKKDGAMFRGKKSEDDEMMIVSGHVDYDAYGRAVNSYYPVTEATGQPGKFNTNIDNVTPTSITYDVMDRTLVTTLPDGAQTKTEYGFDTDRAGQTQLSTSVTDANGKVSETFTDVKGRQTAVKAPGDTWTSFVYDAINQLVGSTDPENHTTTSVYDMLGRRVSRSHPDAGLTEYTYDLAGNMTTQTTANLRKDKKQITYEYEYSRLTAIKYPWNTYNNVRYVYGKSGDPYNRAGRIVAQEDASGAQEFFYGPLGEVTKNVRTIVVPGDCIYTFVTQWQYDTWNRLSKMIYPDGEELTYMYNTAGLLRSMSGKKCGHTYNYLTQLGYDKFENRVYLSYGNGTETTYDYEQDRRRLQHITATTAKGRKMMDNVYSYDKVNNILSLTNGAPKPDCNKKGGPFEYTYSYDDLYRLTHAEGGWQGATHEERYTLDMSYSPNGRILEKNQTHDSRSYAKTAHWIPQHQTTYDWEYKYNSPQPDAATHIGENTYTYDANGNQTGWKNDHSGRRRCILWDEENRIRAISDNGVTHHYIYDASGDRVIKSGGDGQSIYVNGFPWGGTGTVGNFTMYVNPYLVVSKAGFTKHFYIEGQRIVSKLGDYGPEWDPKPNWHACDNCKDPVNWNDKNDRTKDIITGNFEALGLNPGLFVANHNNRTPYGKIKKYFHFFDYFGYFYNNNRNNGKNNNNSSDDNNNDDDNLLMNPGKNSPAGSKKGEDLQFYYHPDHLGSSNYITDVCGEVYQHEEYFPFGETFVEERNTEYTPYLFNGKELDEETGLYYYGARYYDPRVSVWQSVDPMLEKYSEYSPYVYTFDNPMKFIDPNGMEGEDPEAKTMAKLSNDVYQTHNGKYKSNAKQSDLDGYALSKKDFGITLTDDKSGLNSAVYEKNVNGKMKYVYVSQGSDFDNGGNDWSENYKQSMGQYSAQYDQSVKNAVKLKQILGNDLSFTGHSLGGGLASANALATGLDATTFNAAGISKVSRALYHLDHRANIQAYVVQGEIVSVTQGVLGLKAEGNIHVLPARYVPYIPFSPPPVRTATLLVNFGLSAYNHTMGSVMNKMGLK